MTKRDSQLAEGTHYCLKDQYDIEIDIGNLEKIICSIIAGSLTWV
jgi:hypothetical protein